MGLAGPLSIGDVGGFIFLVQARSLAALVFSDHAGEFCPRSNKGLLAVFMDAEAVDQGEHLFELKLNAVLEREERSSGESVGACLSGNEGKAHGQLKALLAAPSIIDEKIAIQGQSFGTVYLMFFAILIPIAVVSQMVDGQNAGCQGPIRHLDGVGAAQQYIAASVECVGGREGTEFIFRGIETGQELIVVLGKRLLKGGRPLDAPADVGKSEDQIVRAQTGLVVHGKGKSVQFI